MSIPFSPTERPLLHIERASDLMSIVTRWKAQDLRVGFVPTMGALHDGHLSLVQRARAQSDRVIVSIFVNPAQFAPHEDFDSYPRLIDKDLKMLQAEGVDLAYTPLAAEIYPNGPTITTKVGAAAAGLESDFRPHFFDGVTTVVHTLFQQTQPDIAVFGEKDFQQLMVIREMVARENMPIEIIGAPIMRDENGLALSSRNAYLSAEERGQADMLNQIIYNAAYRIAEMTDPATLDTILEDARQAITICGFDKVDYVSLRWNRVLAAAWLGKTRLIDNCAVINNPQ
ncbi:MAG: pantoate--beta-alanine ligase [Alphaproteobacteria bacterium]|nr:pantoate--beta-alanine ligase [Alphaproteobacteria bacterium]